MEETNVDSRRKYMGRWREDCSKAYLDGDICEGVIPCTDSSIHFATYNQGEIVIELPAPVAVRLARRCLYMLTTRTHMSKYEKHELMCCFFPGKTNRPTETKKILVVFLQDNFASSESLHHVRILRLMSMLCMWLRVDTLSTSEITFVPPQKRR
jgi:hypothetical protein